MDGEVMRNEFSQAWDRVVGFLGTLLGTAAMVVAATSCEQQLAAVESTTLEPQVGASAAEVHRSSPLPVAVMAEPPVDAVASAAAAEPVPTLAVAASAPVPNASNPAKSKGLVTAPGKPSESKPVTTQEAPASKGDDTSTATFSAWLESSGRHEQGKQGVATAVLVAKSPYKCNEAYPYKFVVDKSVAGVSFPEGTVRGMQVTPGRSTMAIPFVPQQEGAVSIAGTLHFSVCTEERCLVEQSRLAVTVRVTGNGDTTVPPRP